MSGIDEQKPRELHRTVFFNGKDAIYSIKEAESGDIIIVEEDPSNW